MKIDLEIFDASLAVAKRYKQVQELRKFLECCIQSEDYNLALSTIMKIVKLDAEMKVFERFKSDKDLIK